MAKQKNYVDFDALVGKAALARNADDVDLSILASLILCASEDGEVSVEAVEEMGRFDASDVAASVKFWRGAGVLTRTPRETAARADKSEDTGRIEKAHKNGAVSHVSVERYTNEELADAIENRVGRAFIDEAQSVIGKMLNNADIARLVGIIDQLGFEEEAVLAILAYSVSLGKKSVPYAEKIAISFYDEDITSAEAVHAQIDLLQRRSTVLDKISRLYGFGGRALSQSEKKLFTSWVEDYGFDMDIIARAYEITVDVTHTPAPKYADAILKKWRDNGLKSLSEVEAFNESERAAMAQKAQRAASAPAARTAVEASSAEKDRELEEWFEAKLNMHFGN